MDSYQKQNQYQSSNLLLSDSFNKDASKSDIYNTCTGQTILGQNNHITSNTLYVTFDNSQDNSYQLLGKGNADMTQQNPTNQSSLRNTTKQPQNHQDSVDSGNQSKSRTSYFNKKLSFLFRNQRDTDILEQQQQQNNHLISTSQRLNEYTTVSDSKMIHNSNSRLKSHKKQIKDQDNVSSLNASWIDGEHEICKKQFKINITLHVVTLGLILFGILMCSWVKFDYTNYKVRERLNVNNIVDIHLLTYRGADNGYRFISEIRDFECEWQHQQDVNATNEGEMLLVLDCLAGIMSILSIVAAFYTLKSNKLPNSFAWRFSAFFYMIALLEWLFLTQSFSIISNLSTGVIQKQLQKSGVQAPNTKQNMFLNTARPASILNGLRIKARPTTNQKEKLE
eukprot:403367948